MALRSVIGDCSRLFPVAAGTPSRLLLGRLTWCSIRVLDGTEHTRGVRNVRCLVWFIAAVVWRVGHFLISVRAALWTEDSGLTKSLEDVEEGDSGEEEGEELSDGDGEDEFEEVLL